ncbi:MAG: GAF domain-containing protein [Ardenticatenia bacterium]|nr:GAF domain-containing protein [Ardenticatenia bacterium]
MVTLSLIGALIQFVFGLYLILAGRRLFQEAAKFGLATLVAALANASVVTVVRAEPGSPVFMGAAVVYIFALATVVPISLYAALSFLRRLEVPGWPARLMLLATGGVVGYIALLLRAGVWTLIFEAEDVITVLTTVNSLFTVGQEVIGFPVPTFGHVVVFMAVVTGVPLLWGIVNWYQGKGTPEDRSTASYLLLIILFMGLVTLPAQVWFQTSQLILLNAMLFTTALLFVVLDRRNTLVRSMLRRASVGQKLGWGFGAVIAVVLGLSLVSVAVFSVVNDQVQDVIIAHHNMLKNSDEILSNVRAARAAEQGAVASVGRENLPAIALGPISRWRKHIAVAEQRLDALRALPLAPQDQERVELFVETLKRYKMDFEEFANTLLELGDPSTGQWGDWVAANQRLEDLLRVSPATQGLLITFFEMQEAEYEFIITHQQVYLQNAQVRQAEFEAWFEAIEAQQLPDNLREAIDQAIDDERVAFAKLAESVGALDVVMRSLQANGAALQRLALQLSERAEKLFGRGLEQSLEIQANGGLVVIGMTVLAFLVALFAVQTISTQLSDEALILAEAAEQLAAGELATRVRLETADELGLVGRAFNQMAARLEDLLHTLEERVARRTSHLETAALVSQEASALADLDHLLNHAVELIRRRFGFYHAQVFLLDKEGKWAVLKASTGEAGRLLLSRGHRLAVGSRSVIGKVTAEGTPVVARDTDTDPIHRKNELLPETRSELAVPMKLGGAIIGALDVQSTQPNAFDDDDIVALQILANQIAISIRNAELFSSLEQTLHITETLYTTGQRLFEVEYEDDLFTHLLDGLIAAGHASFDLVGAMVVMFDDGNPRAGRVVADWSPGEEMSSLKGATLELDVDPRECREWCLPLDVKAQHRLHVRAAGSNDGETVLFLKEHLKRLHAASSVMFPLYVGEQLSGAIFLHSARAEAFESSQLVPFRVLVDEAGTVLHNRRLFERTEAALQETRLLYRATSGFAQAESPEEVVAVALEAARALGFDAVHLAVLPEVLPAQVETILDHEFRVYARAIHGELRDTEFALRLDEKVRTYAEHLITARDTVFAVEHGAGEVLDILAIASEEPSTRFEALVSRPLMTREQMTGILIFLSLRPRQFDERTKRLFVALSEQASAALETVLLFQQLKVNLESTQALYDASAAMAAAATVGDIAWAIAHHLLPTQDAFVAINELDVDQRGRVRGFTVLANYLPGGRPSPHVGRYFSSEEFPSVQRLLEPGYPALVVEDIETDPHMSEADRVSYRRQRVRSMFSVAFPPRARVWHASHQLSTPDTFQRGRHPAVAHNCGTAWAGHGEPPPARPDADCPPGDPPALRDHQHVGAQHLSGRCVCWPAQERRGARARLGQHLDV